MTMGNRCRSHEDMITFAFSSFNVMTALGFSSFVISFFTVTHTVQ